MDLCGVESAAFFQPFQKIEAVSAVHFVHPQVVVAVHKDYGKALTFAVLYHRLGVVDAFDPHVAAGRFAPVVQPYLYHFFFHKAYASCINCITGGFFMI